jgi:hypothetical protein
MSYLKDAAKVTVAHLALAVFAAVVLVSCMWVVGRIEAW